MAQLITPNSVKVVTQNGEVTISLQIDLNINLNQAGISFINNDGNIKDHNINANASGAKKDEDFEWVIPDFKKTEKVDFGK